MSYVDRDYKNESGMWVLRGRTDGVFWQTRIGKLHNNMTQRGRPGGSYQDFTASYEGVTVSDEFSDAQRFADWCVKQIGWGLGYHLDKDLLVPGNRVYCAEHCVFLPGKINGFISPSWKKDKLPGAYYDKRRRYWFSQITVDGQDRQLGRFATEQEAHEVYCAHKEAVVRDLAMQYRDTIDPRAFGALMEWKVGNSQRCENLC